MLKSLEGLKEVNGYSIVNMGELKESNPELFPNGGAQMDYKVFEKTIRPSNFIYYRPDVNSISFTIQDGPVGENGKNGCQVEELVALSKIMVETLDKEFPCEENKNIIYHLRNAMDEFERRTASRIKRGVEGKKEL